MAGEIVTTITGDGYGSALRAVETRIGRRYELECWKGEQYGERQFTSISGVYTYSEADEMARQWCIACRNDQADLATITRKRAFQRRLVAA